MNSQVVSINKKAEDRARQHTIVRHNRDIETLRKHRETLVMMMVECINIPGMKTGLIEDVRENMLESLMALKEQVKEM